MIHDQDVLRDVRASWGTVRTSQAMVATNRTATLALGHYLDEEFWNYAYSLLLLFAFSVLEETLLQMRDEGLFQSRSSQLGALMQSSNQRLAWQDYRTMDRGRDRRNSIAHDRKYLSGEECLSYIDAIERELVAWKVLEGKVRGSYRIEIRPTS